MTYESPAIKPIGSVADITRGGDPDALGDGAAFRGPWEDPTPTS